MNILLVTSKYMQHTEEYLPHLYDPIRREVAVGYVQHELRKLFPHVRDVALWETIDSDVTQWFDESKLLAPVRDFWNGVDAISGGFKLKHIVPWLTSRNMSIEKVDQSVEELWFGTTFQEFATLGKRPSAKAVSDFLHTPAGSNVRSQAEQYLHSAEAETVERNHFPILVVETESKLRVIDGNRRLFKALLSGTPTVLAIVARQIHAPQFFEHWVPTQLLLRLVFNHRYISLPSRETTEAYARVVVELVRNSTAGRYEFYNRTLNVEYEQDRMLLEAVQALLASSI